MASNLATDAIYHWAHPTIPSRFDMSYNIGESSLMQGRPASIGRLSGGPVLREHWKEFEAFADAGANQLVLVMARLKSRSVLPDRAPIGLPRLEARRKCCARFAPAHRHCCPANTLPSSVKLRKCFWFRGPQQTSPSPSGGGGPSCEAKDAD
jgi:hypothetical protein